MAAALSSLAAALDPEIVLTKTNTTYRISLYNFL